MNGLMQDVRYALRQLRLSAGFSVIVVLTLALTIGMSTAVFSSISASPGWPAVYSSWCHAGGISLSHQHS